MFARSVKYLYETNRFRLGKLDRTSSTRFLFAYRTKTEPCDWRSLHRWLSPPEIPATTWTQMAPPLWCHPSCYLHPPRIQGWRGTTSTSKGKINSFWPLFHIFSKSSKLSLICFFLLLLNASLKTRGFGKFINQWMGIILFLDRWIENLWLLYALQIYFFFFSFHLSRFIIKIQFPIAIYIYIFFFQYKLSVKKNTNIRSQRSNQFKQSSSQIKIILERTIYLWHKNCINSFQQISRIYIYKYFIVDHIRKHSRRVDCNFN